MTYAIQTLENQAKLLKDCLSEWDATQYPEAHKDRERKLKEVNDALKVLTQPTLFTDAQ
jgi:hypothetical protein